MDIDAMLSTVIADFTTGAADVRFVIVGVLSMLLVVVGIMMIVGVLRAGGVLRGGHDD